MGVCVICGPAATATVLLFVAGLVVVGRRQFDSTFGRVSLLSTLSLSSLSEKAGMGGEEILVAICGTLQTLKPEKGRTQQQQKQKQRESATCSNNGGGKSSKSGLLRKTERNATYTTCQLGS